MANLPMAASGAARDPVCGMAVDPARAAASLAHDGATYHFCSKGCAARFRLDAEKFLVGGPKGMSPEPPASTGTLGDYVPLIVVVLLIGAVTAALAFQDARAGAIAWRSVVIHFMAGFFLVFGGFKLLDLRGFADGYSTYDLLGRRSRPYAFAYPFIEVAFGLTMVAGYHPDWLLWTEFGVMAFSGLGVALKLAKGERFQCACLGTVLKVPLTNVTLIEDFGMAALALAVLLT